MLKIAVILGSTRPGRVGEAVAKWVLDVARQRDDAEFELVGIADYSLPPDKAMPPARGRYGRPHAFTWAEKIASFDGFVFVTPEYSHSTSGALKNAIDCLVAEWTHKAAGFVSYGVGGGARAVEHLRLVMAELKVATMPCQVALSIATDFKNYSEFAPGDDHVAAVGTMLDQVVAWSNALAPVRNG